MSRPVIERCLEILAATPTLTRFDITGGAPELHPDFRELVTRARAPEIDAIVMVRHNLTVTYDPHPQTAESMDWIPDFLAENAVEVICSLPYYQEYFTDKQRGSGVFQKSIKGLRRLNALGYGRKDSGLVLNLVYNPIGAYLPAPQADLERDYRKELKDQFDIEFNQLFAITNMPVNRFRSDLERRGKYDEYMEKLMGAFNPTAVDALMCRSMLSVDYKGQVFDCDFNQMLDLPVELAGKAADVFSFDESRYSQRQIRFESHCFGCTAGAGSSCGGNTA